MSLFIALAPEREHEAPGALRPLGFDPVAAGSREDDVRTPLVRPRLVGHIGVARPGRVEQRRLAPVGVGAADRDRKLSPACKVGDRDARGTRDRPSDQPDDLDRPAALPFQGEIRRVAPDAQVCVALQVGAEPERRCADPCALDPGWSGGWRPTDSGTRGRSSSRPGDPEQRRRLVRGTGGAEEAVAPVRGPRGVEMRIAALSDAKAPLAAADPCTRGAAWTSSCRRRRLHTGQAWARHRAASRRDGRSRHTCGSQRQRRHCERLHPNDIMRRDRR